MKICILSAGVGSRIGSFTNMANKAILPLNNKAVISHIIDHYNGKDVEFIIAVGHEKSTVIDYLNVAYDNLKVKFVEIDNITGPGAGPGYSLLKCKKYLNEPFILTTADTIVFEKSPELSNNWVGISKVSNTKDFCSFKIKNDKVIKIDDKIESSNEYAWIGLAGIKDYEIFFNALEKDQTCIKGETQISNGLCSLLEKELLVHKFTWFDTGSIENYEQAKKALQPKNFFDFGKDNEILFFTNNKVIKFFNDINVTKRRVARSKDLNGLIPKISKMKGRFYSYDLVPGDTFYNHYSDRLFKKLLEFFKIKLFQETKMLSEKSFKKECDLFYFEKTKARVKTFFEKSGIIDEKHIINDLEVESFNNLIKKIDFNWLSNGIQTVFHGDLQFVNIIYNPVKDNFSLIDWRDSFGNTCKVGDLYYDLSKLNAGICMPYNEIKKNKFSFTLSGNNIIYDFNYPRKLINSKNIYNKFINNNGYDLKKIEILTALIYLNMSGLHNDPLDHLLFFHGKYLLNSAINDI